MKISLENKKTYYARLYDCIEGLIKEDNLDLEHKKSLLDLLVQEILNVMELLSLKAKIAEVNLEIASLKIELHDLKFEKSLNGIDEVRQEIAQKESLVLEMENIKSKLEKTNNLF